MIRPDKLASYLAITIGLLAAAFSVLAQDDRSQGSHFKELRDAAIRSVQGTATPASAASAPVYTKADITKDTPCGAPGVGEVWGGERRGQIEYRDGVPGVRVNSAGMWSKGCKMPPPPKDCPETHVTPWRGDGGWRLCTPAKHAPLRAQDVGQEWSTYTPAGREPHGYQRWRCVRQQDGSAVWTIIVSHCHGR